MFKCWSYNPAQKNYTGSYETADHLPSGLYTIGINYYQEPTATKLDLRQDAMMRFQSGPLEKVLIEIDKFWSSKDHYKKLGFSHKRGILLHGPHGCGKTGIISVVIDNMLKRNGLVFQVNEMNGFGKGVVAASQIENGRPMLALLEDLEKIIDDGEEEELLESMDGASSIGDGILFLATTNHLNKIPARVRCRPSRIDTVIEIGFPDTKQRFEYLRFLLPAPEKTQLVRELVAATNRFSLAALKELVISLEVYGKDPKQSIDNLRELSSVKDE
jgi:hypothetical protein